MYYTDPAQHIITAGQDLDTDPAQHLIPAGQDLDMYYTDPAQHIITADQDLDTDPAQHLITATQDLDTGSRYRSCTASHNGNLGSTVGTAVCGQTVICQFCQATTE